MGEVDQSFKRLFLWQVDALLKWLIGNVQDIRPVSTDLATERQLLPDTLYLAIFEGILCLINVEIQSEPDDEIPYRLYIYAARARHQYKLPVISIVIWVFDRGTVPTPPYRMEVGSWYAGEWNYHSIKLYEQSPQTLLDAGIAGLLPLVPLAKDATDADAEAAMLKLKQETPSEEAKSLGALLAIFLAHTRDDTSLARQLYERIFMANVDNFIETNPLLHDVWERMIAKGEAQGEARGMRLAIQKMLEGRLGPLSEDMLEALNRLDVAQLSEIAPHAGIDSLEELRARLGLNGHS
jgi:predicted transposase YdaD